MVVKEKQKVYERYDRSHKERTVLDPEKRVKVTDPEKLKPKEEKEKDNKMDQYEGTVVKPLGFKNAK